MEINLETSLEFCVSEKILHFINQDTLLGCCRNGSALKRAYCFSRGPEVGSQHTSGCSQLPLALALGDLTSSLASWAPHSHHSHPVHITKNKINL